VAVVTLVMVLDLWVWNLLGIKAGDQTIVMENNCVCSKTKIDARRKGFFTKEVKNNINKDNSYVNLEYHQNNDKKRLNQSFTGLGIVSFTKREENHISNKTYVFINHNLSHSLNHRVTKDFK
jgi:hypothetical protein